jgi:hypothetical protein
MSAKKEKLARSEEFAIQMFKKAHEPEVEAASLAYMEAIRRLINDGMGNAGMELAFVNAMVRIVSSWANHRELTQGDLISFVKLVRADQAQIDAQHNEPQIILP